MESRGIVRRVDELGRIVLPREMRKLLNIREGTRLEISIVDGDKFLLSKHSPMVELKSYAENVVRAIASAVEHEVVITDMEEVIFANKKKYFQKKINIEVQDLISKREPVIKKKQDGSEMLKIFESMSDAYGCQLIVPIVKDGDSLGAIMVLTDENYCFNVEAVKVCKAFATFLSDLLI